MKFFEEPKLDVLKFAVEDVITVSGNGAEETTEEELALMTQPCI